LEVERKGRKDISHVSHAFSLPKQSTPICKRHSTLTADGIASRLGRLGPSGAGSILDLVVLYIHTDIASGNSDSRVHLNGCKLATRVRVTLGLNDGLRGFEQVMVVRTRNSKELAADSIAGDLGIPHDPGFLVLGPNCLGC
jgi:hypothetical protein